MSPLHITAAVVLAIVLAASHWKAYVMGADGIQAKWDKETADRVTAENAAILTRVKNNEREREQQLIDNRRITKAHHEELEKVRADIARAPGLRIGPALCAGFAAGAEAGSTSRGHGADPGR